VETAGAINDLVREAVRYYPGLSEKLIRVIIVHPDEVLLPELGEKLGCYAERKLRERKGRSTERSASGRLRRFVRHAC